MKFLYILKRVSQISPIWRLYLHAELNVVILIVLSVRRTEPSTNLWWK